MCAVQSTAACRDDMGWQSFCRPVRAFSGFASAVDGSRQSQSGHSVCFSATGVPAGRVCLGLYDMTVDDGGLGRQEMIQLSPCLQADCLIPAVTPMCETMGLGGYFWVFRVCVDACMPCGMLTPMTVGSHLLPVASGSVWPLGCIILSFPGAESAVPLNFEFLMCERTWVDSYLILRNPPMSSGTEKFIFTSASTGGRCACITTIPEVLEFTLLIPEHRAAWEAVIPAQLLSSVTRP